MNIHRKYFLLISLFSILLIGLPCFTFAVDVPVIGDVVGAITNGINNVLLLPASFVLIIFTFFLAVLALVLGFLVTIIGAFLTWISNAAINTVVVPQHVPIVQIAWTLTHDFANLFILIFVVIIGLSTILKLNEAYQFKKAIPALIIAVIIINFSPVLVGFMVDTSNIAGDFFLKNNNFCQVLEQLCMEKEKEG